MKSASVEFPSNTSHSDYDLKGYVYFEQKSVNLPVSVRVKIYGLPTGTHGFHIHEYPIKDEYIQEMKKGKKIKELCKTLGGHFNPCNTVHGSYTYDTVRHAGDLINNLVVDCNKNVNIMFEDTLISLYENKKNCILNKSVVIHESPDDEGLLGLCGLYTNKTLTEKEKESLKTGNAGKRIACGNINKNN